MKSLLPEKYHINVYYFSLCILVIGMPVSKFMISTAQLIMLTNWILEGNLKNKIVSFWNNKPAVVLSSLLILHFLGLIYTNNFQDAYLDLRIKVPLFVLPLILSTSKPIPDKIFNAILKLFIASVLFGTCVSILVLTGIIYRPIVDMRGISIFISHIRFALLICVAIFVSGYLIRNSIKVFEKLVWYIIIIWLLAFLVLMESMTGISVLIITSFILIIYKIIKSKSNIIKYGALLIIIGSMIFSILSIREIINERNKNIEVVDFNKLDKYTAHGNEYMEGEGSKLRENGHLIWMYVCDKELKEVWSKRSRIAYESTDKKGNTLRFTIVRFLASKGLRKDGDALTTLSDDEIKAIERGETNVNYQSISSLKDRIYETMWELDIYKKEGDANGHSLTQRFEYWKVASNIIKNNLLIGVGTGDVQDSFDEYYIKMKSKLDPKWRLHSHNQYLSIAVAFGLVGLLWFLLTLLYPMIKLNMTFDYLYITFFIIALISFFTEDTLETQAGVTFYAFLNSFFLFCRKKNE